MKKSLNLKHYSFLTGTLLAVSPINSQIIYTDVDPDIHMDPDGTGSFPEFIADFYPLDINDDGEVDFSMFAQYVYYIPSDYSYLVKRNIARIIPKGENAAQADEGTPDFFDPAHVYLIGQEINSSLTWHDAIPFTGQAWLADVDLIDHQIFADDWLNQRYKYAGLRLKSGSDYNYGWIRLSVSKKADAIIIHDYAYNSTLNTPILTGDAGFCNEPVIYGVKVMSGTTIKIMWAPVLNTEYYQINYRPVGADTWNINPVPPSATSEIITGLDCDVHYEIKIRAICSIDLPDVSDFSPLFNFITAACKYGIADKDESIHVFPNPSSEQISIDVSVFKNKNFTVEFFDLSGRKLRSFNKMSEGILQLDISDMAAGIYTLIIFNEEQKFVKKLIIE